MGKGKGDDRNRILLPRPPQQETLREFDEVPENLQDLFLPLLLMSDGPLPFPHHLHPAQMLSLLVADVPVVHRRAPTLPTLTTAFPPSA